MPKAGAPPPSSKALAWMLVQPAAAVSGHAAARALQDAEAARVACLARRSTALVRRCGVRCDERRPDPRDALEAWVAEARTCGLAVMETFAAGLEHDGAAMRAAPITPWSDGQAEGQVNRLKTLKRQMCGRAGFELLRRRTLFAALHAKRGRAIGPEQDRSEARSNSRTVGSRPKDPRRVFPMPRNRPDQ